MMELTIAKLCVSFMFYSVLLIRSEISLPTEPNYETFYECIYNITATYSEKRDIIFLSEEITDLDFLSGLVNVIDRPIKVLGMNNLTTQQGFFIFLAQKNKVYSKILDQIYLENSRFLLVWTEQDPSVLHMRSIFQEFWSFEVLDIIALVKTRYSRLGVSTYFPYTKTQCGSSGSPITIDFWSPYYSAFTKKVNLFGKENKVYNLHGCPLKCAAAHRPPDSVIEHIRNKTYDLSGIGGLLFQTIVTKLNFTAEITRVIDVTSNYEAVFNNDSSALSIEVGINKVDIGFGIFTRLLDYHPDVLFVKEINMDCFTWAVPRNAGKGPSMWTTYLGEFTDTTWYPIVLSLFLVVPIFYVLTRLAFQEKPTFQNWDFLTFFVYYTFLGASVKGPQSNTVRMFYAPWLFYSLVLIAAYNAQLGSYATIPTKAGNIENTADLLATDFSITGAPQMFHVLNASSNTSTTIRSLLNRFEVLPPGDFLTTVKKVVVTRRMAVFSTKGVLKYTNERLKANNMQTSYLQPGCLFRSPCSPLIVRRTSPFREPLLSITRRLFEAGILSRWETQAMQHSNSVSSQYEPKLYLEQMTAAFLLLFGGLLLSVLVFVGEFIAHRWIWPPPDLMTQLIADGYTIPYTN